MHFKNKNFTIDLTPFETMMLIMVILSVLKAVLPFILL